MNIPDETVQGIPIRLSLVLGLLGLVAVGQADASGYRGGLKRSYRIEKAGAYQEKRRAANKRCE